MIVNEQLNQDLTKLKQLANYALEKVRIFNEIQQQIENYELNAVIHQIYDKEEILELINSNRISFDQPINDELYEKIKVNLAEKLSQDLINKIDPFEDEYIQTKVISILNSNLGENFKFKTDSENDHNTLVIKNSNASLEVTKQFEEILNLSPSVEIQNLMIENEVRDWVEEYVLTKEINGNEFLELIF